MLFRSENRSNSLLILAIRWCRSQTRGAKFQQSAMQAMPTPERRRQGSLLPADKKINKLLVRVALELTPARLDRR